MKKLKIIFIIFLAIILLITLKICINKIQRSNRKENGEIILFLGDSLTNRYNLDLFFSSYYTVNSGIGGDITKNILNNMEKRVYKYNPSKVFLLIGINDLIYTDLTDEDIKNNIEKIIDNITNYNPKIKVYLESVYPVNENMNKDVKKGINNRINAFNKEIEKICKDEKCEYINVHDDLTDKNNNLNSIYTKDGIHLNNIGYYFVTKKLHKYIDK